LTAKRAGGESRLPRGQGMRRVRLRPGSNGTVRTFLGLSSKWLEPAEVEAKSKDGKAYGSDGGSATRGHKKREPRGDCPNGSEFTSGLVIPPGWIAFGRPALAFLASLLRSKAAACRLRMRRDGGALYFSSSFHLSLSKTPCRQDNRTTPSPMGRSGLRRHWSGDTCGLVSTKG
jgi:hypothetical protein